MNITIIRANALGTPRVPKTAKVLSENFHNVTILYWDRNLRIDDGKYSDYLAGIEIKPIKTMKAKYNAFYSSLVARFLFLSKLFIYAIKNRSTVDIYHTVDFDSAFPIFIASIFFRNIEFTYDIADFLEDYDTSAPEFLKKWIAVLSVKIQKRAKNIIVPDKNRFSKILPEYLQKVSIVNNAPMIDVSLIKDLPLIESITHDKYNIIYYGVLSKDRGMDIFIQASNELHEKYNFYVAGTGAYQEKIENARHIKYLGELEYKQCLRITSKMDLSYIMYDPEYAVNRNASPNKLYEAVMLSIPVIVAKGTSIDKNVTEDNLGYICEYDANALIKLLDNMPRQLISVTPNSSYSFEESMKELSKIYCQ